MYKQTVNRARVYTSSAVMFVTIDTLRRINFHIVNHSNHTLNSDSFALAHPGQRLHQPRAPLTSLTPAVVRQHPQRLVLYRDAGLVGRLEEEAECAAGEKGRLVGVGNITSDVSTILCM